MDIFFDTTVLVAASEQSHPHYARARAALLRVAAGRDKGYMGQHSNRTWELAKTFEGKAAQDTRFPAMLHEWTL